MPTTNHDLDHDDKWRPATGHDDNRPLHGSNSSGVAWSSSNSVVWGLSTSIDFAGACVVFFSSSPSLILFFPRCLACL
jgi:hypothetical protein